MKTDSSGLPGRLVIAAVIGIGALAQSAWGQGAAPAGASDAGGSLSGVEEVVVTARRRSEDVQSVPLTVAVVSAAQLQANNVHDVMALQYLAPSLTLSEFGEDAILSLRGQGGYDPGSSPAVVAYLNEVPVPPTVGSDGGNYLNTGFLDLESVQVLSGPQGTLFGRNTTGGAILYQSRRPSNDLGGYVQLTGGNYRDRELEFALNLPLVSDRLLVRIAGRRQQRDGYTQSLGTPQHPDGLDLDNRDNWEGRVTVTFRPVAAFQNDTIFDTYHSNTHNSSSLFLYAAPNGLASFLYPNLQALVAQQLALGPRAELATDVEPFNRNRQWSLTDIAKLELSDTLALRNILGYYKTETSNARADGSGLGIFDFPNSYAVPTQLKQLTEELQLQGESLGRKLTWVTGGFLMHQPRPPADEYTYLVFGNSYYSTLITDHFVSADNSKALYAQGTYDLSSWVERLKFTAGYRYTWDDRFAARLPDQQLCMTQTTNPTCYATFSAPTWTLALDYQLAPQTLLYGTVRRGYRSGGLNPQAVGTSLPQTFPPEFVTDQELGIKSVWRPFGIPARTNLAVFHQDYSNIHASSAIVLPDGQVPVITTAGASGNLWGAEFAASLFPVEGLELGATGSWLNLAYTHFAADLSAHDIATLEGRRLDDRPRFKYGLSARYQRPLGPHYGSVSVGADWAWQGRSGQVNAPDVPADALKMRPAYGWLNFSADWNGIAGGPIDMSVFVTNVTNKAVWYGDLTVADSIGISTAHYLEPRMYGLRLRYNFGK